MARRAIPHTCSAYAVSCIRDTKNQPDGVRAWQAAKASCMLTDVHVGPYGGIRYAGMAKRYSAATPALVQRIFFARGLETKFD
jgi:hypothetical protein